MPGSLQPSGENNQIISSTITTTLPKFVFLLFLGIFFYNDDNLRLLNDCLTPSISTKSWISKYLGLFGLYRNSNGCGDFLDVFTSHRCINELFIVDNAEVLRAISEMTAFQRFRYLLIVMTCKFLVPYLLQLSMLMLFLVAVVFFCYHALKLLEYCDFDTCPTIQRILERVLPSFEISSLIGINYFGIALGLLIASFLNCFVSSHDSEKSDVCEDTSCLYCITGLANTVFKEIKTENTIMLDPKFVVMYPAAKLICLCMLTALLWIFTVLLTCYVVYLTTSVFYNIRTIGSVMIENLQGTPRDVIQSAWNKCMPSLPESVSKLF